MHLPNPLALILLIPLFYNAPSAPAEELTLPSSAEAVRHAGGRVLGKVPESTQDEDGLLLGTNLALAFPTEKYFNPPRGSIKMEVSPTWNGTDGESHTLFHLGDGNAHVTIFKTDGGSLRFVYKASPAQFSACDINVSGWKPDEWHRIEASWLQVESNLLLQLKVDGETTLQSGAKLLTEVPQELFLGRRGTTNQPAEARIRRFHMTAESGDWPYPTVAKKPVDARVDLSERQPLRRVHDFTTIWNNRENPLPFNVGDPEYHRFLDAQFRMVRLVAFSEGWLWGTRVTVDDAGRLQTDFTDLDRLLEVFTTAGAEPYIRLAYHTPKALVDPSLPRNQRSYALPVNLDMWDELMERIVRHVRFERRIPVKYWVTALNEGDIPVRRGQAEPETIYKLYERTSRLVKRLDPDARVGGPALAWSTSADGTPSEMLVDFLRFCRDRNVPLDFICFHGYRKAHPRDYERLLETIRSTVETEWPAKADGLEYFLDEWNLWQRDKRQDNEYAASYLAGALQYQRRSNLTKSSIVSFNHFLPTSGQAAVMVEKTGPFSRSKNSPVCFEVGSWTCGNEERPGFRLHPPNGDHMHSFARFTMDVPAEGNPTLHAATGVAGDYDRWSGCGFSLVALHDGQATTLLEHFQRTRSWRNHRVSLAPFAGRRIRIEFRTDPGPNREASGDWAVWAEPRVVAGAPQAEPQTASLLDQVSQAVAGARREAWQFEYDDETIARYSGLPLIKGPVVTTPYFIWIMHSRLGDHEAEVEMVGSDGILDDDSGGLTATVASNRVTLLLWHFDLLRPEPRQWNIRLDHLPPPLRTAKQLRLTEYRVDHEHNNPYTKYVLEDADDRHGKYNLETAELTPLRTEALKLTGHSAAIQLTLPNQSVSLLDIEAAAP